jgi:hypothetical protein
VTCNTTSVIATALLMAITRVNVSHEAPSAALVEGTGTQLNCDERSALQRPDTTAATHGYTWDKTVRPAGDVAPVRRLR